eukprot:CAMPEP_0173441646 /NCGR_PEP_ID=MMETSP1357-20121228/24065_1 /TAXON_ID=77926 /ORGANISM="Hemiselmis rufescens, Strain PCC563" /LENGTH=286 /DNA_ID=CAMNT_0014407239 /DNA_START=74 /DNA_END=929 /DNA_ORIENTATION=+
MAVLGGVLEPGSPTSPAGGWRRGGAKMEDDPWGGYEDEVDEVTIPTDDDGMGRGEAVGSKFKKREDKEFKVPEGMSEVSKAVRFLSESKVPMQIRCGVGMVLRCVEESVGDQDELVLAALETLLLTRAKHSPSLQVLAGEALAGLSRMDRVSAGAQKHLINMCKNLLASQDESVVEVWRRVLALCMSSSCLSADRLRDDFRLFVLWLCESSRLWHQRRAGGLLVAPVCERLSVEEAVGVPKGFESRPKADRVGLIGRAIALCQDTDHRVRLEMAAALPKIASSLAG